MSLMVICILIAAAINSSKFIENIPISVVGNLYRHADPFRLNPLISCSHALEIVVSVSYVKVILFTVSPLASTCCSSAIHI